MTDDDLQRAAAAQRATHERRAVERLIRHLRAAIGSADGPPKAMRGELERLHPHEREDVVTAIAESMGLPNHEVEAWLDDTGIPPCSDFRAPPGEVSRGKRARKRKRPPSPLLDT